MAFTTLISTAVLASRVDRSTGSGSSRAASRDDDLVIVDCRYKLDDEAWGAREYAAMHIPGAVYAHLGHDLAGPKSGTNGRHPLPDPVTLKDTFGRLGITSGVQVVAYDQDNGMFASRLWWLLRWMGHDTVAVLDGGFKKWFLGTPRVEMAIDANAVAALSGKPEWTLVDARAPERYRGETEPIDKKAGHIPGAANHFFGWNLDERGTFRTPEELRAKLRETIGSRVAADHIVCYCGSGVTACHNLLALEHAGLKGAKLYPGSWSEWSADPSRPVESGN
jgi:thiosulfate/3-mercaptopyruvate sulfurtransferase